jgi:hypothetical protein
MSTEHLFYPINKMTIQTLLLLLNGSRCTELNFLL